MVRDMPRDGAIIFRDIVGKLVRQLVELCRGLMIDKRAPAVEGAAVLSLAASQVGQFRCTIDLPSGR